MKSILLYVVWSQACFAGRLQIILPYDRTLDVKNSWFDSNSLLDFNKHAFGISGSSGEGLVVNGEKLFDKPKALIIISITGLENFEYDGHVFNFTDMFQPNKIREHLKRQFGENMIHAEVNSSGFFSSPLFKRNSELSDLNNNSEGNDILNMDKLSAAILEKDRKNVNVVDFYRVHLDASNARTPMEKKQLEENIKRGIDNLQDALNNSYGGKVISEIYTHDKPDKNEKQRIKFLQKVFRVTQARHVDYAATTGIMILTGFCFLFAVSSILWFIFSESDMGKHSLVYRLSTARQKKD